MDYDSLADMPLPDLPDLPDSDGESDIITQKTLKKSLKQVKKAAKRIMVTMMQREALSDFIQELPPPDHDLWIIGNGSGGTYGRRVIETRFEFGHFIPVLIDLLGGHVTDLYISTWTMNRDHAQNILDTYDERRADRIVVLTDPYFLQRESFVANALVAGMKLRGQTFIAFKNHTKMLALATEDGRTCVIQGSANLSSTPRAENWVLTTSPDVYEWVRDSFFEVIIDGEKGD
jgi:hypothetical protein